MTHIRQRTDSAATWAAQNPVLDKGEAAHESDTGKWKLGDGTTAYNALPYKMGVDSVAGRTGAVTLAIADVPDAAPLVSPAFTGSPTAPTPITSSDSTRLATTAFVKAAVAARIAALVDSSPATLDTLNELAAALGDDPNFATTMTTALGLKAPLASPTFTGDPKAPTPAVADNDTSIATTAFVNLRNVTKGKKLLPLISTNTWTNPTTPQVFSDSATRTALTLTLDKALAGTSVEAHIAGSIYLSSGAEQNISISLRIGGTDYLVALVRTNGASPTRVYFSGHAVLTGIAAGALTVEPTIHAGPAGTLNMYAGGDAISYTVREVTP